jgi:hypothetical protein
MPLPDIDQGYTVPTALPHPSDGPFAKQRHDHEAFRHKVAQDKIAEADGPCQIIKGSGPPGQEPTYSESWIREIMDEETRGILRQMSEKLDRLLQVVARIELVMTSVMAEQQPKEEKRWPKTKS